MRLKIKLFDGGIMPTKAHPSDAGLDLSTNCRFELDPGDIGAVYLGISVEIEDGWCAIVKERSGLARLGVHVLGGVMDSSYRGQWVVLLANTGSEPLTFEPGDRIAQAIFVPVPELEIEQVDSLSESERGDGGFGSTGR